MICQRCRINSAAPKSKAGLCGSCISVLNCKKSHFFDIRFYPPKKRLVPSNGIFKPVTLANMKLVNMKDAKE